MNSLSTSSFLLCILFLSSLYFESCSNKKVSSLKQSEPQAEPENHKEFDSFSSSNRMATVPHRTSLLMDRVHETLQEELDGYDSFLDKEEYDGIDSLHLEKLSGLVQSIQDPEEREDVALDFLALLFQSEESLLQQFSKSLSSFSPSSKRDVLNHFVNSFPPYNFGFDGTQGAVGSNGDHCVTCRTLKNLDLIMCNQNYPSQPGFCVECDFLKKVTTLLCSLNCTTTNTSETCVKCETLYLQNELLCGPPNCTCGNYYLLESPSGASSNFITPKRSLNVNAQALNCIPCYYQYVAYQLVCGDLFSHCGTTSPTPSPSPPPAVSSSPTASPLPAVSQSSSPTGSPLPAVSSTPSPTVSTIPPIFSATPSSSSLIPSTPSASPSEYYYYNYTTTTPSASTAPAVSVSITPSPSSSSYYYYYYYEEEEEKK